MSSKPVPTQTELLSKALLSPGEICVILEITPRRLQDWRSRRIGPPEVHLGRKVLFRSESLLKWIAEKETSGVRSSRRRRAVAS